MPSKRTLAVALAAMVLASGCSMLPGSGGDAPAETDGPDYHELAFYSHTDGSAYNGTLTVTKDGETVHEAPLQGDGGGTYLNVTTFDEPGPYTVVVNTSIPEAGGGTMREEVVIDGAPGNATVLTMNYRGVQRTNVSLAREAVGSLYLDKVFEDPVEHPIRVTYQGETVLDTTVAENGSAPFAVTDLRETGVYRVEARGINENWANETIVVTQSGAKIAVHQGGTPEIEVYGPDEQVPDEH